MGKSLALAVLLATSSLALADDEPRHPEMWMFDDKPITATAPKATSKKFSITGHLYARVFYDRAIKDVFSLTPTSYQIRVYHKIVPSNATGSSAPIWIPKADFEKTWLDIEIFPDPKTAHTKFGAYGETFHRTWSGADKKLDGTHDVHFEIIVGGANGYAPDKLAEADERAARIAIDFTGHDPKQQAELSKKVAAAGNAAFASNLALPKQGAMHTAALARQTEAMSKQANKEIAAIRVVFTDAAWGIEKHEVTGKTLARVAGASAVVKTRAGKCMVEPGLIRQQFIGGKFVAPGRWLTTSLTPYQVACDKAFK